MNFKLHIILLLLVFSFACENNSELSTPNHSVQLDSIEKQIVDKESDTIMRFSESGSMCNFCSSYEVSVFSNGKVNIESRKFVENDSNRGEKFIEKLQKSNQKLSNEQFQNLISEFEKIDFLNLEDLYVPNMNCPEILSDSSTIQIFYKNEKQSKTVSYYQGCKGNTDLVKLASLRQSLNKIFRLNSLLTGNIMANTNK